MNLKEANEYFLPKSFCQWEPTFRIKFLKGAYNYEYVKVSVTVAIPDGFGSFRNQVFHQKHTNMETALDLLKLGFEKWQAEKAYWKLRNS